MTEKNLEPSSGSPNKVTAEEKVARKRSIPAQVVLWLVVVGALFLFYRALSGHSGH